MTLKALFLINVFRKVVLKCSFLMLIGLVFLQIGNSYGLGIKSGKLVAMSQSHPYLQKNFPDHRIISEQHFSLTFSEGDPASLFFAQYQRTHNPETGRLFSCTGDYCSSVMMFEEKDKFVLKSIEAVAFKDVDRDRVKDILVIAKVVQPPSLEQRVVGTIYSAFSPTDIQAHPMNGKLVESSDIKTLVNLQSFLDVHLLKDFDQGLYLDKHKVVFNCSSGKNGECSTFVEDYIAVGAVSDSRLLVHFQSTQANGHSCELQGEFLKKDKSWIYSEPEPKETLGCEIKLQFQKNRAAIVTNGDSSCRYYCGARAHLDGISYPRYSK